MRGSWRGHLANATLTDDNGFSPTGTHAPMTNSELALMAALGGTATLVVTAAWVANQVSLEPRGNLSGVDPILGARDRIAVYRASTVTIPRHPNVVVPMPDHLKTSDEMVAWLVNELPKRVEEAAKSKR